MSSPKKVFFHTFGCRLNQAETDQLAGSFRASGYQLAQKQREADIFILNTCTVTEQSDAKIKQWIRACHRNYPLAQIAVTGCYAQMDAKEISKMAGVSWVVGNENKHSLVEYIVQNPKTTTPFILQSKIKKQSFEQPIFAWNSSKTRAHLKIQDGCDFMCSFCIIPFSRGRSRSRRFENLIDEAKQLAQSQRKEIVLTGVNVGTYQDQNQTLLHVIDELQKIDGIARIRISSIEPTTVPQPIFEYMADPQHKLVPFLHLPIQSASNSILHAMKRRYTQENYIQEVMEAFELVPEICIGTDVMVGFPNETEAQFLETVSVLERLPLGYFHVFPFSKRQGTPAAKLVDHTTKEKKQRVRILRELSKKKKAHFQERFVGKTKSVLMESTSNQQVISGYTENYIRVEIPASLRMESNQIYSILLTKNEMEYMEGELLSK